MALRVLFHLVHEEQAVIGTSVFILFLKKYKNSKQMGKVLKTPHFSFCKNFTDLFTVPPLQQTNAQTRWKLGNKELNLAKFKNQLLFHIFFSQIGLLHISCLRYAFLCRARTLILNVKFNWWRSNFCNSWFMGSVVMSDYYILLSCFGGNVHIGPRMCVLRMDWIR